jgi:TRAP-type C4-dicarboxylate transport system permease small subunit
MKWIIKGEEIIMEIALIVMSVLAFVQVITRYVFEYPNSWIEETTRYLMVWMIFIGMAYAVRKEQHLEVGIISLLFPSSAAKLLLFFDLVLLIFAVIFTGLSGKVVVFQWEMGQTSPGMGIPIALVYLGLFLGGILMIIHQAVKLYKRFRIVVVSVTAGRENC